MYFSASDITATLIALSMSILMIVLLTYSNVVLMKQNRFLKERLKANRIARMRLDNYTIKERPMPKESGWSNISRFNIEIEIQDDDVKFNPTGKAYTVRIIDNEQEIISDGVANTLDKAFMECFKEQL
jgi:hypothetical protein